MPESFPQNRASPSSLARWFGMHLAARARFDVTGCTSRPCRGAFFSDGDPPNAGGKLEARHIVSAWSSTPHRPKPFLSARTRCQTLARMPCSCPPHRWIRMSRAAGKPAGSQRPPLSSMRISARPSVRAGELTILASGSAAAFAKALRARIDWAAKSYEPACRRPACRLQDEQPLVPVTRAYIAPRASSAAQRRPPYQKHPCSAPRHRHRNLAVPAMALDDPDLDKTPRTSGVNRHRAHAACGSRTLQNCRRTAGSPRDLRI